jgi:glucose-1-phosphate cytidylyltransferase
MKVAILAGGLGSRIQEETEVKPKPMVEIGGRPMLWHIMKLYAHQGFRDFVVALGYKGDYVKRYMVDYAALEGDLTIGLREGRVEAHGTGERDDWNVALVDTGQTTNKGGRIKRLAPYLGSDTFMLTWGDGVSDIDLRKLLEFHRAHGKLATLTAVRPPARFGHNELDGDVVAEFSEKPQAREGWINGAFFVLEPGIFEYIAGDSVMWEREPLERLAKERSLAAYMHKGFWQPMDTLRDKNHLEEVWSAGRAPWKTWR